MPRAFEDAERNRLRAALLAAGLKRFEREGLRAARIDDLCRDVGIAKGSFYAFFPSKEELFMALVEKREEKHRADMRRFLRGAEGGPQAVAGGFFDLIVRKIETDPVLNIVLINGEIPYLVRKLGAARFEAGQQADLAFANEAAELWAAEGRPPIDAGELIGLLTIMMALVTQRRHMTEGQYRPALALLRELFVGRLAGTAP